MSDVSALVAWPSGQGEMAKRIAALDWAATAMGSLQSWPPSLRTAVDMMLAMPGPANIIWGPHRIQLYNDGYIAIARERHPSLLGRKVAENWPEIYTDTLGPILDTVFAGEARRITDLTVELDGPDGRPEQRIFDTTWVPVRDEGGAELPQDGPQEQRSPHSRSPPSD